MSAIQTTHVGSLPRPPEMMTKVLRNQPIAPGDLRTYLEAVMRRQLSLGLTYVNNGELPRMDYVSATVNRIAGFNGTGIAPLPRDLEELPEYARRFGGRNGLITLNPKAPVKLPACSHPLEYTGEAALREELTMMTEVFAALTNGAAKAPAALFFTAPSPGTVALFMENAYYSSYAAYLERIGEIMQQEYPFVGA